MEYGEETMSGRRERNAGRERLIQAIMDEYGPESVAEAEEVVKDLTGGMIEVMMEGEMDAHLGYRSNDHKPKETTDRRNGYITKTVHSNLGDLPLSYPRDRDATFTPQIVPKHCNDISGLQEDVLLLYADGMSERDITDSIYRTYGVSLSAEKVSMITDCVLDRATEWCARPLKETYLILYVDCTYVPVREGGSSVKKAVYTILGVDMEGRKDILGFWIDVSESKNFWMNIFDELKVRGVKDVGVICMDGVVGLSEAAELAFPKVCTQRCIVHLVRNSMVYIPNKKRKEFAADLKLIYNAPTRDMALLEFRKFKEKWGKDYPGAVRVWERNLDEVLKLFDYGSAVRRAIYTTNAIESVYSSLKKVKKRGVFPSENSVYKLFYLREEKLQSQWENHLSKISNWYAIRNEVLQSPNLSRLMEYCPDEQ